MAPSRDRPEARNRALSYGGAEIGLDLSRFARVITLAPAGGAPAAPERLLEEALAVPIASERLADLAGRARRVVISIPDATRPPFARQLLPGILKEISARGRPAEITVFLAAGVHGCVSEEAARRIAGRSVPDDVPVLQNDARRPSDFTLAGTTRRGTPVSINRALLEADLNVVIGSAAFHYFAGFGGGRKMVVPGACEMETVRANHRLAITGEGDIHPRCRSGVLEGNPVHEDMVEGLHLLRTVFLVNVVPDPWGRIAEVTCGDGVASHLEACRRAAALLEVPVGARCDLAVASAGGLPWDVDLIQAHKAIDHAAEAVRDGGAVVAVAQCSAGVGSETFLPWFDLGGSRAVAAGLKRDYRLNGQTALSLLKKLERLRIILVSSLDPGVVRRTGMECASTLDEAVAVAEQYLGGDPMIYVLPNASGILPRVEVSE